MAPSIKSRPEQTEPSTQDLPTIPEIGTMQRWDNEKLLRWIQQRNSKILEDHDLDTFNRLRFTGVAFLRSDYKFFHETCHLSPIASLGLEGLADQVKEGKFISWM
jgi:hypothetical protein